MGDKRFTVKGAARNTVENAARNGIAVTADSAAVAVMQTWCYGNSYRNSLEIIAALGIPQDMTFGELQRRLEDPE
jgi:hypothetical protein